MNSHNDVEKFIDQTSNMKVTDIPPDTSTKGQRFVDELQDISMYDLFVPDDEKTRSAIIKKMAEISGTTIETLAKYLGCKTQSLRNKMFRNSFSIDDLLIAAHACNFSVILKNNLTGESYPIDIVDFFKPHNEDVLVRLSDLDKQSRIEKQEEYNRLKAKLEEMKNEYGFDE